MIANLPFREIEPLPEIGSRANRRAHSKRGDSNNPDNEQQIYSQTGDSAGENLSGPADNKRSNRDSDRASYVKPKPQRKIIIIEETTTVEEQTTG